MTIKELVVEAQRLFVEKGWEPRDVPTDIALMHSELSEALEEFRNGRTPTAIYFNEGIPKPEGIPIELADVVIRIAQFCGMHGIDLENAIAQKMAYNETRPWRHGGKVI